MLTRVQIDLLPEIVHVRGKFSWTSWDLAAQAASVVGRAVRSPLLNPGACDRFLTEQARLRSADGYAGGYLEDRGTLWRGSYLDPYRATHLGIDISAPAGSVVLSPVGGTVHEVWTDRDEDGGWGGRVIIKRPNGMFYVIAHLSLEPSLRVGAQIAIGSRVGTVAPPDRNGGWWPHVHLQSVRTATLLQGLDGYGADTPENGRNFPNPLLNVA